MILSITLTSILVFAGLAAISNLAAPMKICPVCAGVSATWMWMLALNFAGYEIDLVILGILMGGSIVGVAYQLEKKLPAGSKPFMWKILFIPAGFAAVYGVLAEWWGVFSIASLFAAAIALVILLSSRRGTASYDGRIEALKEKMKDCC